MVLISYIGNLVNIWCILLTSAQNILVLVTGSTENLHEIGRIHIMLWKPFPWCQGTNDKPLYGSKSHSLVSMLLSFIMTIMQDYSKYWIGSVILLAGLVTPGKHMYILCVDVYCGNIFRYSFSPFMVLQSSIKHRYVYMLLKVISCGWVSSYDGGNHQSHLI